MHFSSAYIYTQHISFVLSARTSSKTEIRSNFQYISKYHPNHKRDDIKPNDILVLYNCSQFFLSSTSKYKALYNKQKSIRTSKNKPIVITERFCKMPMKHGKHSPLPTASRALKACNQFKGTFGHPKIMRGVKVIKNDQSHTYQYSSQNTPIGCLGNFPCNRYQIYKLLI